MAPFYNFYDLITLAEDEDGKIKFSPDLPREKAYELLQRARNRAERSPSKQIELGYILTALKIFSNDNSYREWRDEWEHQNKWYKKRDPPKGEFKKTSFEEKNYKKIEDKFDPEIKNNQCNNNYNNKIIKNLIDSLAYAWDALLGKWKRWIILIIAYIIYPLIAGYSLRIMRGTTFAPEPNEYFRMFINGIKLIIIEIIYMVIPIFVGIVALSNSGGTTYENYSTTLGISMALFIIVAFIFSLFGIIGMVRFARTGSMGEAFAFGEITNTIGKIGWVQYIIALIVLFIVVFVIYAILGLIPVIGGIINIIIAPYIIIMTSRYFSNLYDTGA